MQSAKTLFTLLICLVFSSLVMAQVAADQDTIVIPGGQENAGLLETTINGDVDGDGNRINPDRVYKLQKDQIYFQYAAINVNNPEGTITIVGEEGGKKPIIIPVTKNDIGPYTNYIVGSLTLKNIHHQGKNDIGSIAMGDEAQYRIQSPNQKIVVEDCLFEFCQHEIFMANEVSEGLVIEMRNNYFRDLFWKDQWWASRVWMAKVPIDTLIFENNTITGSGMALLQQDAMCEYAVVNHNTFVNNHCYVMINNYYHEAYFTNNLFYNCQWPGEDKNIIDLEPDKLPIGIVGIDTISASIKVPEAIRVDANNLIDEYNHIENYKIYCADNIYYNQPVFDDYYGGSFNSVGDYPVSYLTWSGVEGPHEVKNTPAAWMNSRAQSFFNDFENIVEENNILDQDPKLNVTAITPEVAEQLAIWNRIQYNVADETRTPELNGYYFGDNDPLTIPGVETEDGNGITKFSDLIEDLSYSANIKSQSDGYSIGALHWTNEIESFDSEASLNAIKEAYLDATDVDDEIISIPLTSSLEQNYPNPFNPTTTIKFSLVNTANVKINVYNLLGQKVATLLNETRNAGAHEVTFNAADMPTGVYFYNIEAGDFNQTLKMLLLK